MGSSLIRTRRFRLTGGGWAGGGGGGVRAGAMAGAGCDGGGQGCEGGRVRWRGRGARGWRGCDGVAGVRWGGGGAGGRGCEGGGGARAGARCDGGVMGVRRHPADPRASDPALDPVQVTGRSRRQPRFVVPVCRVVILLSLWRKQRPILEQMTNPRGQVATISRRSAAWRVDGPVQWAATGRQGPCLI